MFRMARGAVENRSKEPPLRGTTAPGWHVRERRAWSTRSWLRPLTRDKTHAESQQDYDTVSDAQPWHRNSLRDDRRALSIARWLRRSLSSSTSRERPLSNSSLVLQRGRDKKPTKTCPAISRCWFRVEVAVAAAGRVLNCSCSPEE